MGNLKKGTLAWHLQLAKNRAREQAKRDAALCASGRGKRLLAAGPLYSGVAVIHGVTVGGLSYAHSPLVQSSARSRNRAYTCECAAAANVHTSMCLTV